MRVTSSMIASYQMKTLQKNAEKLSEAQQKLAEGKKFVKPSDDPAAVRESLKIQNTIKKRDVYSKMMQRAEAYLGNTESDLNQSHNFLIESRTMVVGAAQDIPTNDRDAFAGQINEFLDSLANMANGKIGEQYVYSGTKTDTIPFVFERGGVSSVTSHNSVNDSTAMLDTQGFSVTSGIMTLRVKDNVAGTSVDTNIAIDPATQSLDDVAADIDAIANLNASVDANGYLKVNADAGYDLVFQADTSNLQKSLGLDSGDHIVNYTYNGNNEYRNIPTGKDQRVPLNLPGNEAFSQVFDTLIDLRDLLVNKDGLTPENQTLALTQYLDVMDTMIDTNANNIVDIGSQMTNLQSSYLKNEADKVDDQIELSEAEDIDFIEALNDIWNSENVNKSSMYTISKLSDGGILNYLT